MDRDDAIEAIASHLRRARRVALFTGAGISTESGIPDFRSPGGIWSQMKPIPFDEFVRSEAQRREGASLKHDVSLPIGRLAEFIDIASRWLGEHVPEAVLVCYGHVGDGNLHFNLSAQPGDTSLASRGAEIRRVIHDLVAERGGSFSAEHGIGQTKVDELARYAPAVELEIMHGIKHLLDPNGIMNPGKVLRAGRTP